MRLRSALFGGHDLGPFRDRFFATVRHERVDGVPVDLWARPEVIRNLQSRLGTPDISSVLGVHFAQVDIPDRFPEYVPLTSQAWAAAGLDLIEGEWTADIAGHPLVIHARSHSNLIITPRLGGVTLESQEMACETAARKLIHWLAAHS